MAGYYNPYMSAYPAGYTGMMPYNYAAPQPVMQQAQQPQYMINVDGENAAKSWQPVTTPQPNTIIPLFDSDGQHVYFKAFDAYGRMNPLRKGHIVFDDEEQVSEMVKAPDMSAYAKTDDIKKLEQEIETIKQMLQRQINQNGINNRGERR